MLLLDNDCVIVPGLGGFMSHHTCAQYDADTQTFLPPSRQLGFNAQLTINDSLLAQSYIETYDISYPEAIRRIEDEVNELNQVIRTKGRCELNGIGTLFINNDGKTEFLPCEAGLLTPSLYGLNALYIDQLSTQTHSTETASIQPISQQLAEVDEDTSESDSHTITMSVSTLKYAAMAACAIVLLLVSLPFGTAIHPDVTESYMDTGILYRILPKEVRTPSGDTTGSQLLVAEPVKADATPAKTTEEAVTQNTTADTPAPQIPCFSIVLASKVTIGNAEIFVSDMKKHGFADTHIVKRTNGAKVVYGRFRTETEARDSLRKLRSQDDAFAEGWIMEF